MSLSEIQRAVDTLAPDERLRLTAWMVARYPLLTVEQLMAHATALVDHSEWAPTPPTEENYPKGKVRDRTLRLAAELDLGK
jgi:hypothetical protein